MIWCIVTVRWSPAAAVSREAACWLAVFAAFGFFHLRRGVAPCAARQLAVFLLALGAPIALISTAQATGIGGGLVGDFISRMPDPRNWYGSLLGHNTTVGAFTLMMFYIAYAQELIGDPARFKSFVVTFLIVQVCAQFVSSPLSGFMADRYGNRSVLRVMACIAIVWPIAAVVTAPYVAQTPLAYLPVYICIGLLLPANFLMTNYYLEIAPEGKQATYVGITNACMTLALVLPPLVGLIISYVGFVDVFLGVSFTMIIAVLLSLRLKEPRHRKKTTDSPRLPGEPRPL